MTTPAPTGLEQPDRAFSTAETALIIGAGLAGCACARTLAGSGFTCKLYDRNADLAAATSAVPAAIHQPHLTRTDQLRRRYYLAAYKRSLTEFSAPEYQSLYHRTGLLKLVDDVDSWSDHHSWERHSQTSASLLAGTTVASEALYLKDAGWISPHALCTHWVTTDASISFHGGTEISGLRRTMSGWLLLDAQGKTIDESRLVILANGGQMTRFDATSHFPLQALRGQMSFFDGPDLLPPAAPIISGKGYILPGKSGFWSGATHQRDNTSVTTSVADDLKNAAQVNALLPDLLPPNQATTSWAGVRCTTPDRLPLIGAAPDASFYRQAYADLHHGRTNQSFPKAQFEDGLFVIGGFGSRGVIHSLHAATALCGIIQAEHSVPPEFLAATHPGRFLLRQLRRN